MTLVVKFGTSLVVGRGGSVRHAILRRRAAEIAGVVAHLLSDDSVPTSGAAIPVYGRA